MSGCVAFLTAGDLGVRAAHEPRLVSRARALSDQPIFRAGGAPVRVTDDCAVGALWCRPNLILNCVCDSAPVVRPSSPKVATTAQSPALASAAPAAGAPTPEAHPPQERTPEPKPGKKVRTQSNMSTVSEPAKEAERQASGELPRTQSARGDLRSILSEKFMSVSGDAFRKDKTKSVKATQPAPPPKPDKLHVAVRRGEEHKGHPVLTKSWGTVTHSGWSLLWSQCLCIFFCFLLSLCRCMTRGCSLCGRAWATQSRTALLRSGLLKPMYVTFDLFPCSFCHLCLTLCHSTCAAEAGASGGASTVPHHPRKILVRVEALGAGASGARPTPGPVDEGSADILSHLP